MIILKILDKLHVYFTPIFLYQDQVAKTKTAVNAPPPFPKYNIYSQMYILIFFKNINYQTSLDLIRKDICTNIVDEIRKRILNSHLDY